LWVGRPETFVDFFSSIVGRERAGFHGTVRSFAEHLKKALDYGVAYEKYKWLANYAIETVDSSTDCIDVEGRSSMEKVRAML
jgi:hypothetical protein